MRFFQFLNIIVICLGLGCTKSQALIPTLTRQHLDKKWEFVRGDLGSVWEVWRPTKAGKPEAVPSWQQISIPHCYNATDACDPEQNYYEGPGWYRTVIDVNNPYQQGRTYLEFEGSGQKTEVYVFTHKVASHVGGYDEWKVDITEAVRKFSATNFCKHRFGGKIPLAIRCDNSRDVQMIPSDMSDFNLYGGIYRHLNLVYVPQVNMSSIHLSPSLKGQEALVGLDIRVNNPSRQSYYLQGEVADSFGSVVHRFTRHLSDTVIHSSFVIAKPLLWSPDSPALYTCRIKLISGIDTILASEKFGIRHYEFREHGPFLLNGKRLLLRGTHRHEDHAGVGAAMTDEMIRQEMQQIKDMGANFIRLGHYQQSDLTLHLCDSLGIMAWEEIPWCRGGIGGEKYRNQARRMLSNMISQHFNHPSIILWGMGNENDWEGDFPEFSKDSVRAFMSDLVTLSHRLDSSRLTVCRRCDFASDIVDVYSPSIWAGWYSRRYRDYYDMEYAGFRKYPRFIHAEWGGDSHVGRNEEQITDSLVAADRNGKWSETYMVKLFDWHLKEQERMPWLSGSLFWTFKDFSTPLRPHNPIPYVNQKGVVQRDGTPKETYFVFQAYWSKKPMIHIYGHSWPIRWGKPETSHEVLVYSNCPKVELFVNGQSMGVHQRNSQDYPAAGFHWNVVYQKGRNKITAVAHYGEKLLTDEIYQEYEDEEWHMPHHILLQQVGDLVQATVMDSSGKCCLDASQFIRFGSSAPDILPKYEGTATGSRMIQLSNGKATIRLLKKTAGALVFAHLNDTPFVNDACISIK
ncbi:glycoside hydrolase family 2 protein [Hallella bergensis]|uniref:glycoside hydrolase family 2 protein n=1 Tax=Hallella bergensis TaxID=242750 RepID=UPI003990CE27